MITEAELSPCAFVDGVPEEEIQRLLAEQPLSRLALPDGTVAWNLVRAADVSHGLARLDHYRTPSVDEAVPEFPDAWRVRAMMTLEPPDHTHARKECAPLVEVARLEVLRPTFAEIANKRVAARDGTFELVEDLSAPVAAHMGAAYLGVAPQNYEYFRRVSALFMADTLPPRTVGPAARAVLGPHARAASGGSPAQAVVELIKESFIGSPWADADLIASLPPSAIEDWGMQFVTAGTGGTRACITYAVQLLSAEWPDWRQRVDEDPPLLTRLVHETIRLASPLLRVRRILSHATELYESRVPAGATVLLWLAAANRDPRMFAEPTRFDPWRAIRRIFSFGGGPHHCLGHPIANMQVEEFLRAALRQWTEVEILGQPARPASNVVNEISALPIRVTRAQFIA